jgi:hypothetical protein
VVGLDSRGLCWVCWTLKLGELAWNTGIGVWCMVWDGYDMALHRIAWFANTFG